MSTRSIAITVKKPLTGFRKPTAKDIGWGKTIYIVCDENSRNITLDEFKIEKLNLSDVPPKVGHNAFQHDTERDQVNAERLRQMKKLAGMGHYYIKDEP